jgi:Domain of unknown function (DUF5122) beta-propeller
MRAAVAVGALVAALALVGCGAESVAPQRVVGFKVQRALALDDGSVLLAGARVVTAPNGACGDDLAVVLPRARSDGCVRTVDSLDEERDGGVLVSAWIYHPSEGCCEDNSSQAPVVVRFVRDGLDEEFGRHGLLPTGEPSGKLALEPDESIVTAAGRRYSRSGDVDNNFSAPVQDAVFAGGIAALPNARFAVASLIRSEMRAFVLQVFDHNGRELRRTLTTFAPARRFGTADVLDVVTAPGALYVFGRYSPGPGGRAYAHFLYRYDLDGHPDPHFGSRGALLLGPPGRVVTVDQVAVQRDGDILAVGADRAGPWRLFIVRYLADGTIDRSFGDRGIRYLSLGSATSATLGDARTAIAVGSDGRIVVAGTTIARRTRVFSSQRTACSRGSSSLRRR